MKNTYKDDSFSARLDSAAKARQAVQARVKSLAGPGDSAFEERQAARRAAAVEREARQAQRRAAREAEIARQAAERAAKEAEAVRLAAEEAERKIAEEAQRKAARDARYAARKARQR